jgi:transposase-like protein
MRLRVRIPPVEPTVMVPPEECPYDDCQGRYFKLHQQRCKKAVRDTKYEQVEVYRRKCLKCQRTHRVYPQGVSEAQQTDRLKGASVMLYVLGLSYRGVEDMLTALGFYLSYSSVYRNIQAAGAKVLQLRQAWLKRHSGGIRIVGGDLTYVKCKGEEVVIGVAVDAQQGLTLDIRVLDNQETETLQAWLQPLLEATGAEVLTTDDADAFKTVADEAGVKHQVCRRHVTSNVLDFIAKTAERILNKPPAVPEGLDVSPEQLLTDLETLEWIMLGHPGPGEQLLREMFLRYADAVPPKKGRRATIWYRMRNHVLHLWNHWKRLICYRTLRHSKNLLLNATNNATERAIGWSVKDRYRTMRGYKRDTSILNVTSLTAWLLEQPAGYDMSPLFAS